MVAPATKRQAVAHLRATLRISKRRACMVVGADRTSMRYRSCRADDGDLRSRLCELAGGSAIGGCTSCFVGTASRSTTRRPSGSTVRKG
jgi:hypothetical protein